MIRVLLDEMGERLARLWSRDPSTRARAWAWAFVGLGIWLAGWHVSIVRAQIATCSDVCAPHAPDWRGECYCALNVRAP